MSRKTRPRRRRELEPAPAPVPAVDKTVDWARLRAKFTSLTCRREPVLQEIVFVAPVVAAKTPAELLEQAELAIVAITEKLEAS